MQTRSNTGTKRQRTSPSSADGAAEVITFTYGGRHIAVRKPVSYMDAGAQARRLFDLPQSQTLRLSISMDGRQVELGDEDAWTLVGHRERVEITTALPAQVQAAPTRTTAPVLDDPTRNAVFAKVGSCKTITVDISDTTTVIEFKMAVQRLEGIPPDQQRVIFAGKQLEDERLLTFYGVQAGSLLHLILRLRGGKPVILFYYPEPVCSVDVHLALRACWDFSAVYPVAPIKRTPEGQTISWKVDVDRDGLTSASTPSIRYSSLFWEAETNSTSASAHESGLSFDPRKARLDRSNALVFTFRDLVPFLESTLRALQLTDTAATDFMQYWIPNFTELDERDMDIAISFLPMKRLDEVATLSIQPAPDVVFRVFLLFKGVSKTTSASWNADEKAMLSTWLADVPAGFQDNSKQRVLEWGGMQVY